MEEALDEYIEAHCSPEDPVLYRLYRATNTQLTRPRMASGHMQGLLLRMLVGMVRPRRILEVGTYSGYSALAMASAMPPFSQTRTGTPRRRTRSSLKDVPPSAFSEVATMRLGTPR